MDTHGHRNTLAAYAGLATLVIFLVSACEVHPRPVLNAATATAQSKATTSSPTPTATNTDAPPGRLYTPTPTVGRSTATRLPPTHTPLPTAAIKPTRTSASPITLAVQIATPPVSPTTTLTPTPGAIPWEEAIQHIGETTTVCGPVASAYYASSSRGKPTFLNIGKKHPDPERFTVVIWGRNRPKFSPSPEELYNRKTICVSGEITEYNGIAEIEVSEPGQIVVK
jgi:hypothetical protein